MRVHGAYQPPERTELKLRPYAPAGPAPTTGDQSPVTSHQSPDQYFTLFCSKIDGASVV